MKYKNDNGINIDGLSIKKDGTKIKILDENSNFVNIKAKIPTENDDLATKSYVDSKLPLPTGCIVMWSGSVASIPSGWALCNGSNGTPNLRDKFIVGAGNSYSPGNTGGANTIALTINQMPVHNHNLIYGPVYPDNSLANRAYIGQCAGNGYNLGDNTKNGENATTIKSTGGGQTHENRPPYYALCFIMKL